MCSDLAFALFSHRYFCFLGNHLHQRRGIIEVLDDISIINCAILFRHIQSGMTKQGLERESISSAIHKVFPGKGVAIQMGRGFLHPSGLIVPSYRQPQTIHGQHITILIAEQVIVALTTADSHILPQNRYHHRAERNGLDFAILIVAEDDLPCIQIHIPVLNIADGGSTATAVHKKIDDHPITVFAEGTVLRIAF